MLNSKEYNKLTSICVPLSLSPYKYYIVNTYKTCSIVLYVHYLISDKYIVYTCPILNDIVNTYL